MKRSCGKVGKRSVFSGLVTPLQAIWSVIQTGLRVPAVTSRMVRA